MTYQWLEDHVSKVASAFSQRLYDPGNAYRTWEMIYCESKPGTRGGIAVIPSDDITPAGWLPVGGVFDTSKGQLLPRVMTRDQIRTRLWNAVGNLPVLDPSETI